MSKLVRIIGLAIAIFALGGGPSSAAGGAGDVKGVGGGWVGFPSLTSAKFVHFSFSAHSGPNGDFGQIQFTVSDDLGAPLDVSATVDCLNILELPDVTTIRGAGWFSAIVTKVDDPADVYPISPRDRLYFQIVDGGDPSNRPVDDFLIYFEGVGSCKDLPPILNTPDVTQGNIVISTN